MMTEEKKRLIIIDSNSIIHRAFHALPLLTTKKGEKVSAIYGFLLVFLKAVREFQPDYIAAAFDLPGPTFRHKQFREYKAKRPLTPEELCQQIPKVKEVLRAFNVPIFEREGFEADDIIGTIVEKSESKTENIILSGDLDSLQLVSPKTKVYSLRKGVKDTVLYDEKSVKEKYQGLEPWQLIDFKALRGDPSDNVPGVPGIGEKTALKLIREFGSLENLYEVIQGAKSFRGGKFQIPEQLKIKLLDNKEKAFLSKSLVRLVKNIPINFNLKKCQWQKYDKRKVIEILKNFEFYSLIKRLSEENSPTQPLEVGGKTKTLF